MSEHILSATGGAYIMLIYNKTLPGTLPRLGRLRSLDGGVGLFRFYYSWFSGHWWVPWLHGAYTVYVCHINDSVL